LVKQRKEGNHAVASAKAGNRRLPGVARRA